MGAVVQKIFLDLLALIAKAKHEILDAMRGVDFHDVPKDWAPANIHHGLWAKLGFRAKARAAPAGENDGFSDHEHPDKTEPS
jgi:hypothetical protein